MYPVILFPFRPWQGQVSSLYELQVKILVGCVRTYCIVSRGRSLWRQRARHLISFHWLMRDVL